MTRPSPARLMALLFTDIVGSVALKRRLGDEAYVRLLSRHNELFAAVLAALPGAEQIKATGDGFLARFASASSAIEAALLFQWALGHEAWQGEALQVRVGVHVGEAVEIAGSDGKPDVIGLAVDLAARIMGLALPGQILLTRSAYDAGQPFVANHPKVADAQPALRWVSHAKYLMQGHEEPIEVFEVGADGFAPLRSPPDSDKARRFQRQAVHNLPRSLDSFVGRGKELAEIKSLFGASRILTLTGSGGSGKTRLALRLGHDLLADVFERVCFVDLSALADAGLVAQEVRGKLDLKEQPGKPVAQTIIDYLAGKSVLLILDNCEYQVESCAALVSELVGACPNLKVLATSQKRLDVAGETVYRVPSLSLPADVPSLPASALASSEAATLFIERARAVKHDFQITNATAATLANICRRLDGMPLAIELVAPRVRALSLDQIARQLEQTFFRVLTSASRSLAKRHETLRAAIQWSYNLLSAQEKLLLQRLSVFSGGWTIEAAEKVCADDPSSSPAGAVRIDEAEVTEPLLMSLCDLSLVTHEDSADGQGRYRLLESVRLWANEELERGGGTRAVRARHLAFFLPIAEEAELKLLGHEQKPWLQRVEAEHNNLLAALRWGKEDGDAAQAEKALRLVGALWSYWDVRGGYALGRAALADVLTRHDASKPTAALAKAYNAAGFLAFRQGDFNAGRPFAERSLAMRRALGDRPGVGRSLTSLGNVLCDQGDYVQARRCYEEALEIHHELGIKIWEAGNLTNLADICIHEGDWQAARTFAERGRAMHREVGNRAWEVLGIDYLTMASRELGDLSTPRTLQRESLALKQEMGDKLGIAVSLALVGGLASAAGQAEQSATLLAAAARQSESIGSPFRPTDQARFDRDLAAVRAALSAEAFERAWASGASLSPEEAMRAAVGWLTGAR